MYTQTRHTIIALPKINREVIASSCKKHGTSRLKCDQILENCWYTHIYQNLFYWFFVVYRDRGMDWLSFSFMSKAVWEIQQQTARQVNKSICTEDIEKIIYGCLHIPSYLTDTMAYGVESLLIVFAMNLWIHGIIFAKGILWFGRKANWSNKDCRKFFHHCNVNKCL